MKLLPLHIALVGLLITFTTVKAERADGNWGTKTLYTPQQTVYTAPPQGYQPVFINHVGRHGARHLSSITADSLLYVVLQIAQTENGLTATGIRLKQMDSLLLIVEKGNVSLISETGIEEQKAIGQRMKQQFSAVFAQSTQSIQLSTTKKERTKQSAKAFLKGLNLTPDYAIATNYSDMDNLAFYDVAPAYKRFEDEGDWKTAFAIIQNTERAKALYSQLPKLFFTDAFIQKLNSGTIQVKNKNKQECYTTKHAIDAYFDACSIFPSIQGEIAKAGFASNDLNFSTLVSAADLETLNTINCAEDFLLKAASTNAMGIQVRIAVPLLVNFINTTDEYISSKKLAANLRFAHAETIAPFAALLGITGASESIEVSQVLDFEKVWKCNEVIPLSANIQWIVYKGESDADYLVKFMLNEKEVIINGLSNSGTPFYYRWNEVKAFYLQKLKSLNVKTTDDMHSYLLNAK